MVSLWHMLELNRRVDREANDKNSHVFEAVAHASFRQNATEKSRESEKASNADVNMLHVARKREKRERRSCESIGRNR